MFLLKQALSIFWRPIDRTGEIFGIVMMVAMPAG